ncbi:MAG: nucleotidyltransferase domain-containing protein [Chloroflexota bacterium]
MTPATEAKRQQLQIFIDRVLVPWDAVKGVVAIGSMASGHMSPESDIDAVLFLEPYDLFVAPAEALWNPADDTFHSIFAESDFPDGIPLDLDRCDLAKWRDPAYSWPEGKKAELSMGLIVYDPSGQISALIAERTAYSAEVRQQRLDESLVWLDQHLNWKDPQKMWDQMGPAIAHDRLNAAYSYLAKALFAYNGRWQIWRNREMQTLLQLPWLPAGFQEKALTAASASGHNFAAYQQRIDVLREMFQYLLDKLVEDGDYSSMPIDQAFIRQNQEPGRAWNMEEWNTIHRVRRLGLEMGPEQAAKG